MLLFGAQLLSAEASFRSVRLFWKLSLGIDGCNIRPHPNDLVLVTVQGGIQDPKVTHVFIFLAPFLIYVILHGASSPLQIFLVRLSNSKFNLIGLVLSLLVCTIAPGLAGTLG